MKGVWSMDLRRIDLWKGFLIHNFEEENASD